MPVRKFKKSYIGQPSLHMSQKVEHLAAFAESTLERDFYVLLKFFGWVLSYEEQPCKVQYVQLNSKLGEWTPDTLATFGVTKPVERWLYELKYRSDLKENWPEYKQKFRGALFYCQHNDIDRFKIMTEIEIRSGAKLKNAKLFLKNRTSPVDPMIVEFVLGLLMNCSTMTTRALLESLWAQGVEPNEACVVLYHLIANHHIGLDIEEPFTYETDLWFLPEGHFITPSRLPFPAFRAPLSQ